jgi:hypothetical protein
MKDHITQFTIREEALLVRARAIGFTLPERLSQWTLWIQDSELYLNELRQAVIDAEKSKPSSTKEVKNVTLVLTDEEAKNLSTVLNTLNARLQYRGAKCPKKDLKKHSEAWHHWHSITKKLATSMGIIWMVDNETTDLLINP